MEIFKYLFLLKTFRNSYSLIQNIRHGGYVEKGAPIDDAILWNGTNIVHPQGRGGLVPTILEVWYENIYQINDFYKPKDDDVVIDLGAHIGLFSLLINKTNPKAVVIALEPSPETFQCLKKNISSAGASNVKVYQLAIGACKGQGKIEKPSNRAFNDRVIPSDEKNENLINIIDLPGLIKFLKVDAIDLLKMDCEGGEFEVFSTIDSGSLKKIKKIVLEYHENWKPGVLALLKSKLSQTHDLKIIPNNNQQYGMLFGVLKIKK